MIDRTFDRPGSNSAEGLPVGKDETVSVRPAGAVRAGCTCCQQSLLRTRGPRGDNLPHTGCEASLLADSMGSSDHLNWAVCGSGLICLISAFPCELSARYASILGR